jgi:hypothetical protein
MNCVRIRFLTSENLTAKSRKCAAEHESSFLCDLTSTCRP